MAPRLRGGDGGGRIAAWIICALHFTNLARFKLIPAYRVRHWRRWFVTLFRHCFYSIFLLRTSRSEL
jgi:hypothetical protein